MSTELIEVAESAEFLWNGVVCTEEGQLFASLPGWLGPKPGVVKVLPDGSLEPFPGNEWNAWAVSKDPSKSFVDVNSITLDGKGSLWIIDAAAPLLGEASEGAVKVVEIDIATEKIKRVLVFDKKDAHSGTRLAHMRFHGHHAFIVESKEASIFVIDLLHNSYRRIMTRHPLLRCDPRDVPTVEGRRMELHGKPMYFHSDLLEFGPDPDIVLFMCLFGRKIFKVHVEAFKDPDLTDADIAGRVSVAFEMTTPFISGITRDPHGNLYLADSEKGGISRLRSDGVVTPVVRDPRIIWPIGPSVGPDGYFHFVDSQVNRIPVFTGGPDRVLKPWKMNKVNVAC
jgi:sugar lactone lactonase YvrE